MEPLIDLEWWRDTKGYLLKEPRAPNPSAPDTPLLSRDVGRPLRIVPCGGSPLAYQPLARMDRLFKVFAKEVTQPQGLLSFINRFGPLTQRGFDKDWGEDVAQIMNYAAVMRSWLRASGEANRESLRQSIGPDGLVLGRVDAVLTIDPITQAPRLRFKVNDLLTGLWMQLGQAITGDTQFRQCEYCGIPFETGPGTGRRSDAKFCSDQHRIAFNSQKRSERSDGA